MAGAHQFIAGQRWRSETEPELGLGLILQADMRTVQIVFPAREETRTYSVETAPLRRVAFRVGDEVIDAAGETFRVESVEEIKGLLLYRGTKHEVFENQLGSAMRARGPEERLQSGDLDEPEMFELRYRTLQARHRLESSRVHGFVGARISLIPHQLSIAHEVASRHAPRVLLADEVGLGKTIEACLIMHRLLATGQARRVLILTPESLIHQWFVELLRRFNCLFKIFDEERCQGYPADANPFLDEQWVLSGIGWLARNPSRAAAALQAGWDLVIIDEAHHLHAAENPGEQDSPEYQLAAALGMQTPGLLLLTATPEQLGLVSHFSRLRLLDPDRFHDLEAFQRETEKFQAVAALADKLHRNQPLDSGEKVLIREWFPNLPADRELLLADLIDRHGTGRVMFRNTRRSVAGFPRRVACLHSLESSGENLYMALAEEFSSDARNNTTPDLFPDYDADPRISWLVDLLKAAPEEKFLLISRSQQKVEAIEEALRGRIRLKLALFHENLTLLQRDRNAAWFAEPDGARLLLCSEIGSEGRNFQFAHHLILFDLPLDPELLEQRIGRLDRIGQRAEIQIHVPFVRESPQEVMTRWYHEALNAFEHNLEGGNELMSRFGDDLRHLALDFHETKDVPGLNRLLAQAKALRHELQQKLEQGRDRLLELSSSRPELSARLAGEISAATDDRQLEEYLLEACDALSIRMEEIAPRTFVLGGGDLVVEAFPGLKPEGMTVTLDRAKALGREDIGFLTWDHPFVMALMDSTGSGEKGNASFVLWPVKGPPSILLEAIFLLEAAAPEKLHIERFLAPSPIRIVVNHLLQNVTESLPSDSLAGKLKKGPANLLHQRQAVLEELLPRMTAAASDAAAQQSQAVAAAARARAESELRHEIDRLRDLQHVNPNVRDEEIHLAEHTLAGLREALQKARPRLDSLRLIWRGQP